MKANFFSLNIFFLILLIFSACQQDFLNLTEVSETVEGVENTYNLPTDVDFLYRDLFKDDEQEWPAISSKSISANVSLVKVPGDNRVVQLRRGIKDHHLYYRVMTYNADGTITKGSDHRFDDGDVASPKGGMYKNEKGELVMVVVMNGYSHNRLRYKTGILDYETPNKFSWLVMGDDNGKAKLDSHGNPQFDENYLKHSNVYETGKRADIQIKEYNGRFYVVETHDNGDGSGNQINNLYLKHGTIDNKDYTVNWDSGSDKYDEGNRPSFKLIPKDGGKNFYFVEMHDSGDNKVANNETVWYGLAEINIVTGKKSNSSPGHQLARKGKKRHISFDVFDKNGEKYILYTFVNHDPQVPATQYEIDCLSTSGSQAKILRPGKDYRNQRIYFQYEYDRSSIVPVVALDQNENVAFLIEQNVNGSASDQEKNTIRYNVVNLDFED